MSSLFSCGKAGTSSNVAFSKFILQKWPGSASTSRLSWVLVLSYTLGYIIENLHDRCAAGDLSLEASSKDSYRLACGVIQLSFPLPKNLYVVSYCFHLNLICWANPLCLRIIHWKSSDLSLQKQNQFWSRKKFKLVLHLVKLFYATS